MLPERSAGQFCLLNFRRAMLRPHFPQALFTKNENRPWVRIASSAQSWVEDPLKARGALGAGCARLQTIIIRRGRGEFGDI